MTVNELIKMLTQITLENKEYVEKRVKKLSEEQINWRPNPGVWNITEVLAHLNSYSEYYHSTFSKKIFDVCELLLIEIGLWLRSCFLD